MKKNDETPPTAAPASVQPSVPRNEAEVVPLRLIPPKDLMMPASKFYGQLRVCSSTSSEYGELQVGHRSAEPLAEIVSGLWRDGLLPGLAAALRERDACVQGLCQALTGEFAHDVLTASRKRHVLADALKRFHWRRKTFINHPAGATKGHDWVEYDAGTAGSFGFDAVWIQETASSVLVVQPTDDLFYGSRQGKRLSEVRNFEEVGRWLAYGGDLFDWDPITKARLPQWREQLLRDGDPYESERLADRMWFWSWGRADAGATREDILSGRYYEVLIAAETERQRKCAIMRALGEPIPTKDIPWWAEPIPPRPRALRTRRDAPVAASHISGAAGRV